MKSKIGPAVKVLMKLSRPVLIVKAKEYGLPEPIMGNKLDLARYIAVQESLKSAKSWRTISTPKKKGKVTPSIGKVGKTVIDSIDFEVRMKVTNWMREYYDDPIRLRSELIKALKEGIPDKIMGGPKNLRPKVKVKILNTAWKVIKG